MRLNLLLDYIDYSFVISEVLVLVVVLGYESSYELHGSKRTFAEKGPS
jgi:hypothetical protein